MYSILRILFILMLSVFSPARGNVNKPVQLVDAFLEGKGGGRKLVLQFNPEIPQYSVRLNSITKATEIIWKTTAKKASKQEFKVGDRDSRYAIATITVNPESGSGILNISGNLGTRYQLTADGINKLVLPLPDLEADRETGREPAAISVPPKKQEKRITLNVKNAPLAKILRSIAAESNRSLIFGNDVSGNVSANVTNLGYEDAVNNILKPTPYRAEHNEDVTIVRTDKSGRALRAFRTNFIDVNQILKTIKEIISKDGQLSVDTDTNTLFVMDKTDVLNDVERMVKVLDQEPQQVEVEAAIVELDTSKGFQMGSKFSATPHSKGGVRHPINIKNLSPVDPDLASFKGVSVGLTWNSITSVLSALSTRGKLTVIAKPRVLALNDQEASIIIGSQIGYHTITVTQTGSIEDVKFLTVGTQLKIKPHITQSKDMLLYIKPEISDGTLDSVTRLPTTNTTSSETKVLAKDGQTIMIGGLLRDRLEKKVEKVPILGDIPLIGILFKGVTEAISKSEIVILLTPKILTRNIAKANEQFGNAILGRAAKDLQLEYNAPQTGVQP